MGCTRFFFFFLGGGGGGEESEEQPFLRGTHRHYQIPIPIKLHEAIMHSE